MTLKRHVMERRRFPRVQAHVYCRPVGPLFRRDPVDVSLGGMRVYSDDRVEPGSRLETELFLTEERTVTATVRVIWVDALPEGGPARYDVGLQFLDVAPDDLEQLTGLLEPESV